MSQRFTTDSLVAPLDGGRRWRRVVALLTAAVLTLLGLMAGATPTASADVMPGSVVAWGSGAALAIPASLASTGATAISVSGAHALALTPDRTVVTWGEGRFGLGDIPSSLAVKTVTAIAAGSYHSLVLTSDGKVTAWGFNNRYLDFGQAKVPTSLDGKTVTAVAAGDIHSLALTSDGKVTAWGNNDDHQTDVPTSLNGKTVTAIAAGAYTSLALTSDGKVTGWGANWEGQSTVPASLDGKTVTAVSASPEYSLALTSDGKVTAWGYNAFGQTDVPASLDGKTVTAIATGANHNLALTSDGRITTWGSDNYGQTDVPASLDGRTVTAIAAGTWSSFALTQGVSPVVSASPASAKVEVGTQVSFTAAATGTPAPTVQWQRADGGAFEDLPGATSTTLTITTAAADDGASFRAVFTNAYGSATTDAATLTVNRPPSATNLEVTAGFESATPVILSGTDEDGDTLTYTVASQPDHGTLTGTAPALTYTPDEGYSGPDSFTYRVADGTVSSATATVEVTVTPQPCTPSKPKRDFSVHADRRNSDAVVRTPKLRPTKPGDLLLAFVAADGSTTAAQTVTEVSGGGLTWTLVQRENTTRGTSEIWQAYAAEKIRPTRVEVDLAEQGRSASVTVAGFSRAKRFVGSSAHASGTSSAPEVSLTPQATRSSVWAVGRVVGSRYHPKPVSGQKIVHDQTFRSPRVDYWTQRTTAASEAGTDVTVSDKVEAVSWGYAAVEIRGTCR